MKKLYKLFIFSTIELDYDVDDLVYYFDDWKIAKQAEKKAKELYKNKEVVIKLIEFNPHIMSLENVVTSLKENLDDFEDKW